MAKLSAFVSHSHNDGLFCREFVRALREDGADVWYDEHDLSSGKLMERVESEIRARPVFIVVLSPNALRSRWVRDECTWAYTLQRHEPARTILPVLAEIVEERSIWLFLQDFMRIELPGRQPYAPSQAAGEALRTLQRPTQLSSDASAAPFETPRNLIRLGNVLADEGDFDGSERCYRQAMELNPNSLVDWEDLARAFNCMERYEDAFAAEERALAIDAMSVSALSERGYTLRAFDRHREAIEALDLALAVDPDDDHALSNKMDVLLDMGREYEAAVIALRLGLSWGRRYFAIHGPLTRP